jgi:hypothetical protein|tara:strand:- start:1998 stop:2270 length:273 start_codon:yes stop_codon:yes gene_type:complete
MFGDKEEDMLTKDEHIVKFIKSFVAIEEAMQPLKEHLRDLRSSYAENDWLTKEDMRMAVKVYRMLKQGDDLEMITDYFNHLKQNFGGIDV